MGSGGAVPFADRRAELRGQPERELAERAERVDAVGEDGRQHGVAGKALDSPAVEAEGKGARAVEGEAAELVRGIGAAGDWAGSCHQLPVGAHNRRRRRAATGPARGRQRTAASSSVGTPARRRASGGARNAALSPSPAMMKRWPSARAPTSGAPSREAMRWKRLVARRGSGKRAVKAGGETRRGVAVAGDKREHRTIRPLRQHHPAVGKANAPGQPAAASAR